MLSNGVRGSAAGILAGIFMLAGSTGFASAAGNVFTVANYPVDADAANAVAAKEKAIAEGQEAAFRSLLKRIVPVTAYKQLERLQGLKAAEILDGVSVGSEQNSATRYIASLDFSFQADAVRATLSREGIPFIEEQAPEIVLVPVRAEGKAAAGPDAILTDFKPASGNWAAVWKELDLTNTVSPVRIASLLPEVKPDTVRAAMAGDGTAAADLAALYHADRVVLAVADEDVAGKRLFVTLAGYDSAGPIAWKRGYRINDNDVAYAEEFASVVSLGVLEGRWKSARMGGGPAAGFAAGTDDVTLSVLFANADEWADLRGRLLDLPGAENLRVGTVSASSAEVSLKFPGGGPALAGALIGSGANLTSAGGTWILRSGL